MNEVSPGQFDSRRSRRLSRRGAVLLFLGLLLGAVMALYRGGGDLYFGPLFSDLTNFFYPRFSFFHRWLGRDVFPLWDPHSYGGYPVMEVQQVPPFSLAFLLPLSWLPLRLGVLTIMAFHVAGAGWATYLGLRKVMRLGSGAAALGSAVYVFGLAFASRVTAGHFTVVAATAWMPLGVFLSIRVFGKCSSSRSTDGARSGSRLRRLAGAGMGNRWFLFGAVVNALTILSGAPQYTLFLLYMQGMVMVAVLPWRRWIRGGVLLVGMWGLAAGLSAPQWLPALSYLPHTERARSSIPMVRDAVDRAAFFLEMVTPLPLGNEVTTPHVHPKNLWETGTYPGGVALVLSLGFCLNLLRRRWPSRLSRVAAILLVGGLYLCLGGPLPGFDHFREPLKSRAVMAAGFCLATALAFQQLSTAGSFSPHRFPHRVGQLRIRMGSAAGIWIAVGGVILLILHIKTGYVSMFLDRPNRPLDPAMHDRLRTLIGNPEVLTGWIRGGAGFAISLAILMLVLLLTLRRWPRCVLSLLFVIGCVEPFLHHLPLYVSRHSFEKTELPAEWVEFLLPRIQSTMERQEPLWRVAIPDPYMNRSHHYDGVWELSGEDPLFPKGANNRGVLTGSTSSARNEDAREQVAAALGLRYDFQKWTRGDTGTPSTSTLQVDPKASVVSIEHRVRLGGPPGLGFGPDRSGWHFVEPPGQVGIESDEEALMEAAIEGGADWLGRDTGWTSESLSGGRTSVGDSGERLIMPPLRSPNEYEIGTALRSPGFLVFRMTWLPGWQVRIDGGDWESPWRANGWMQAVPLERGPHRVVFRYRPAHLILSFCIAFCTAMGMAVWILWRRRAGGNLRGGNSRT